MGQWLSWESASLARMRSRVRIPSAPSIFPIVNDLSELLDSAGKVFCYIAIAENFVLFHIFGEMQELVELA